jgi:hypothetical protein
MFSGFEQLYGCLNNIPCLTVGAMLNTLNLSPFQAFSFVGLLQQYKFMCGAGFYSNRTDPENQGLLLISAAIHENIGCIQRVVRNFNDVLTGCVNTYQVNVQHDPNRACT